MPSEKNLNAVFTDIANAIREKKGTTAKMQPINMADEIANMQITTLKGLLDATESCYQLFMNYKGTSVDELISNKDTSNVTNMSNMFNSCTSLITIPRLDTSKVTNMSNMFTYCTSLESIPQLDTSKVTGMFSMFKNCVKLTTIPRMDVSNVTDMASMFYGCSRLKSILMYGMKVNFDISSSQSFEKSDLVTILNNLAAVTTTKTLTMGSTNLAKLTNEEKAIATNKGWKLQ